MNILTSSLSSALYSQDSLRKNDILLSSSIQRLASGTRLNSAADDAAGVSIALNNPYARNGSHRLQRYHHRRYKTKITKGSGSLSRHN
ncbi:MAG: hypothetical protein EBY22_06480 [Gammaproteobacteria bacterium]|nr:hypothetical protein [Gammaproteobacteria bacterium]